MVQARAVLACPLRSPRPGGCPSITAGLQYEAVAHIYREHRGDTAEDDEARYRQWLNDTSGPAAAGECTPSMDVVETAKGVELILDLPGVAEAALTIVFARGTLIVAGRKSPHRCS